MLIIDMPIPVKEWNCLDCKALCVYMFRHYCGITKKTIDTLKNMRARPSWCPIKGEVVRCGECGHYHSEDDPAYCDELCTIHIDKTDGCLRGIKRGAEVGYRAVDGERKDGEHE